MFQRKTKLNYFKKINYYNSNQTTVSMKLEFRSMSVEQSERLIDKIFNKID